MQDSVDCNKLNAPPTFSKCVLGRTAVVMGAVAYFQILGFTLLKLVSQHKGTLIPLRSSSLCFFHLHCPPGASFQIHAAACKYTKHRRRFLEVCLGYYTPPPQDILQEIIHQWNVFNSIFIPLYRIYCRGPLINIWNGCIYSFLKVEYLDTKHMAGYAAL